LRASHRRSGQSDPLSILLDGVLDQPHLQHTGQPVQQDVFNQQPLVGDISTYTIFDHQLLFPDTAPSFTHINEIKENQGRHTISDLQHNGLQQDVFNQQPLVGDISTCTIFDHQLLFPDTAPSFTQIKEINENQGNYVILDQAMHIKFSNYQENHQNFFIDQTHISCDGEQSLFNDPNPSIQSDQLTEPMEFDLQLLYMNDEGHSAPAQTQKKTENAIKCKNYRDKKKEKKILINTELKMEEKKNWRLKFELKEKQGKVSKLKKLWLKRAKGIKINPSPEELLAIRDLLLN